MVSVEELRKTIEWLRDTTNDNIIYIDKDIKRELGIAINDLIKLNEIYKSKIDKAIECIKITIKIIKEQPSSCELNDIWTLEHLNSFLEILGDKE